MIVVIGGGPAGRYAAMRLAGAGKEVLLVDRRREGLGGQCLHQGCMVVCALNDVARTYEHLELLHKTGIVSGVPEIRFSNLISRMQEIIGTIASVIDTETIHGGVKVITGEATVNGNEVSVNGRVVQADAIIIATGSRPNNPHYPGDDLKGVYTSHTLLTLQELPRQMVIIGGGAIAAEMAYIFSVFGTAVTIISRSALLRNFPPALVKEAKKELSRVTILEGARVSRICGEAAVSGVVAETGNGTVTIPADVVLLAAGMKSELSGITGVKLDEKGFIRVNERMQTDIPSVYAVGDVTGDSWLTPLARRSGIIAADTILGVPLPVPLDAVPQAIKLRNDLAFCGKQDGEGLSVTIPSPAGPGSFWAVPDRATGRVSMTVDPQSGKLLGMLEASPYGSVVAAYQAMLINNGMRVDAFERFVEVHPSADGAGWTGKYLAEKYRMDLSSG
jgi:dihydrolipoamide dehydrogenase